MDIALNVLIIEDSARDAALEVRALKAAGYRVTYVVAETAAEMKAALLKQDFDIVISDHGLPQFDAPGALAVLKQSGRNIPLIVVSGTIGEETAVALMKAGAHDYVMKDRLSRLGPAVAQALKDAENRRERKRAEEARRSEQIMLARTEGIAHVGSWEWNIATDTVTWSDELFRIFQRDPREGAPSFAEHPAFYHPDDMVRLRQAVETAVADGTPYELELRAIRKDGEIRFCVARGVTEVAPDGRVVRLFGSLQDINEGKRAEVLLRQSEIHYRELFEHMGSGVAVYETRNNGEDFFFKEYNAAAKRLDKTPRGQIIGRSVVDVFPRVKDFGLFDVFQRVYRTGKAERHPATFYKDEKIGGWRENYVYKLPTGEIVAVFDDVTERKRAEETLKESERTYRLLADNIHDIIFVLDMNMNYTYVSPSVKLLRGYEPEELLNRPALETLMPSSLDLAVWTIAELFDLEKSEYTGINRFRLLQLEMRRKDGTGVWTEAKLSFIRDENQQLAGILGVTRDITERKIAEDTLRASEQRLSDIIEFFPDATLVIDKGGKVIAWNRAIEVMTGIKKENMLGKGNYEYAIPFYGKRRPIMVDLAIHPQLEIEKYYINIRKTGNIIFSETYTSCLPRGNACLSATSSVLRDAQNQVVAAIECIRDITERKRAEDELTTTLNSLKKAIGATIQVLVSAVEARDPYTAGHQLRATNLACAIATEMGLAEEQINGIRMAGSIHDIGKLSIPSEILTKPSKLTSIEFSLIQEHSRIGYEMVKDVESPWPLAQIIYQHHERVNGTGYPRNLKGDEIIMEARIMAVADVVEAMASHRPYRPALGIDFALEEIEMNRGTLYDNVVADACLKLFREKGYKLPV